MDTGEGPLPYDPLKFLANYTTTPEYIADLCLREIPTSSLPSDSITFSPPPRPCGINHLPIIQKWSKDNVFAFFSRLRRTDIADKLWGLEFTGGMLVDVLGDDAYFELYEEIDEDTERFIIIILEFLGGSKVH